MMSDRIQLKSDNIEEVMKFIGPTLPRKWIMDAGEIGGYFERGLPPAKWWFIPPKNSGPDLIYGRQQNEKPKRDIRND